MPVPTLRGKLKDMLFDWLQERKGWRRNAHSSFCKCTNVSLRHGCVYEDRDTHSVSTSKVASTMQSALYSVITTSVLVGSHVLLTIF